jgi:hypothetical protein
MYTLHRPSPGNSILSHALLTGHVLLGQFLGLSSGTKSKMYIWLGMQHKICCLHPQIRSVTEAGMRFTHACGPLRRANQADDEDKYSQSIVG